MRVSVGAAWLALPPGAAVAATDCYFLPLGDLPGGTFSSWALDVSPDGRIVVGTANGPYGMAAFRWRADRPDLGLEELPELPGGRVLSEALCVDATGAVIGGYAASWNSFAEATRWTDGVPVPLGDFSGGPFISIIQACTPDGAMMVGAGMSATGLRALCWTPRTGSTDMGVFAEFTETLAGDVSANGAVVVGSARNFGAQEAFRFTEGTGMVGLGDLPGGLHRSEAYAVSADGRVAVGYAVDDAGFHACLWSPEAGLVSLGDLPGNLLEAYARNTNADGSVVVGYGTTDNGYEAFYWTFGAGMRRLADILAEAGVGTGDYLLARVNAVSADGRTVVGAALTPLGESEAFIARLPAPAPSADWNRSGRLEVADVFAFLREWFAGESDFDRSGATEVADVFAFLRAWFATPP